MDQKTYRRNIIGTVIAFVAFLLFALIAPHTCSFLGDKFTNLPN